MSIWCCGSRRTHTDNPRKPRCSVIGVISGALLGIAITTIRFSFPPASTSDLKDTRDVCDLNERLRVMPEPWIDVDSLSPGDSFPKPRYFWKKQKPTNGTCQIAPFGLYTNIFEEIVHQKAIENTVLCTASNLEVYKDAADRAFNTGDFAALQLLHQNCVFDRGRSIDSVGIREAITIPRTLPGYEKRFLETYLFEKAASVDKFFLDYLLSIRKPSENCYALPPMPTLNSALKHAGIYGKDKIVRFILREGFEWITEDSIQFAFSTSRYYDHAFRHLWTESVFGEYSKRRFVNLLLDALPPPSKSLRSRK